MAIAHRLKRAWQPTRTAVLLPALIGVMLAGSVVIPGRETSRIIRLLRDDRARIEPARLTADSLQIGLTAEHSAMELYAVSRDGAMLQRYEMTARQDDRRLRSLDALTAGFEGGARQAWEALPPLMKEWRRLEALSLSKQGDSLRVYTSGETAETVLDSLVVTLGRVEAELGQSAAMRRDAVQVHEEIGIISNALLVLAALIAIAAVVMSQQREQRRAGREAALRAAAEAFASAFTIDELTQRIVDAALTALGGTGAFAECVEATSGGERQLVVRSVAGAGVPAVGRAEQLAGSGVETVMTSAEPVASGDLPTAAKQSENAIIIPLGMPGHALGAVVVLGIAPRRFRWDDLAWARVFGQLASLAYEKLCLLEEAREGRCQLERAMESRSRLMRGFSHDVKNPLGAADGYAELLTQGIYGPLTPEQRESLLRLRLGIQRSLSLIDDLHELARAETGNLRVRLSVVDLPKLVAAVSMEYSGAAAAKQLTFSADIEPELPVVLSDDSRLRQIIGNLLSNAIKYTDTGSVTVRARAQRRGGSTPEWALIDVIDTGPGIPSKQYEAIFEEFSRLDPARHSGAGLGLAISKRIAEALGGRITVRSQPEVESNHGSTFTLWIPIGDTGVAELPTSAAVAAET